MVLDGNQHVPLAWEEVKEIAQPGLIDFGSHTVTHRILTTLTDDEIQDELKRSGEGLIAEKVVDPSFIPFSYPNGSYDENIARMVKELAIVWPLSQRVARIVLGQIFLPFEELVFIKI